MGRKPEGLVGSKGKGSILEWNLSAADQVPGFTFGKKHLDPVRGGNLRRLALKIKQAEDVHAPIDRGSLHGKDRRTEIQDRLRGIGVEGRAGRPPPKGAGIPLENPERTAILLF